MEKLNRQNTEHSLGKAEAANQTSEGRSGARIQEQPAERIPDGPHGSATVQPADQEAKEKEEDDEDVFEDSESEEQAETEEGKLLEVVKEKDKEDGKEASKSETSHNAPTEVCPSSPLLAERYLIRVLSDQTEMMFLVKCGFLLVTVS